MFGVKLKGEDMKIKEIIEAEYEAAFVEDRSHLREKAKKGIQKIQEEYRRSLNKKRKLPQKYNLGVLIAIKRTQFSVGKLTTKFLSPYKVIAIKSCDRCDVEEVSAGEGSNRTSTAADFMKPRHRLEEDEYLSSESDSDEPGEENAIEPNEL
ncbi:hypothetical protein Trydic_g11526 [Trypoxylus dichotomus]